jgi:hypothetical protein
MNVTGPNTEVLRVSAGMLRDGDAAGLPELA